MKIEFYIILLSKIFGMLWQLKCCLKLRIFFFRSEAVKELAEHVAKDDNLDKEQTALMNEMTNVRQQKEEKTKIIKEKSKKWHALQRQKDDATARFDKLRKQDESLHAELIETNKRRKDNIATMKTVIFYIIFSLCLYRNEKLYRIYL